MAEKSEAKEGTGLTKNKAAALSYVLGPVTGIIFFILEKDSFVRFHALQSIIVFGGLFVMQWILGITIILAPIIPLLSLLAFGLWLVLIYKAWQGERFEIPVVKDIVAQIQKKV